jgi:ferredoxin
VTEQTPVTPHPGDELLRVAEAVHAGEVSVAFRPGPTVLAKVGDKLLDIAEASQVPLDSGCRMGMCGSDPVRILEGEENLSKVRSAERRTLERLRLGVGCRMACVSRVEGPVVIDPQPGLEALPESTDVEPRRLAVSGDHTLQQAIRRVVVIGAGVAGVTAAEELRRALPDAELTLICDEPYAFYNRRPSLALSPSLCRSKASTSTDVIGRSHAASTTGVACLSRPSTAQTARCIFLTATVFRTTG